MRRRDLLTAAGLAGLGWATGTGARRAAAAGPDPVAGAGGPDGWTSTPIELNGTYLDDVVSTRHGTWAVGVTLLDGFRDTRPLALRRTGGRWQATPTPVRSHAMLFSVAVVAANEVWAVGVDYAELQVPQPLALRWNGRSWRVVRPPVVPTGAFGDVVAAPDGSVWMAGWAEIDGTERGVVYRYAGGRWHPLLDGLEQSINGNALLVESATDAWLALNPGLARLDGRTWRLVDALPTDGSQIITGLAPAGAGRSWAVGVEHTPDLERPLALRRSGDTWTRVEVPAESAQLYDVAIWGGRPVAVGERFIRQPDGLVIFKPYVLEHRGQAFVPAEPPAVPADATGVLTGLAAGRDRLWTVGAVNQDAFAAYRRQGVPQPAVEAGRPG